MATVKEKIEGRNKYVEDFRESARKKLADVNTAVKVLHTGMQEKTGDVAKGAKEIQSSIKTYVEEFIG